MDKKRGIFLIGCSEHWARSTKGKYQIFIGGACRYDAKLKNKFFCIINFFLPSSPIRPIPLLFWVKIVVLHFDVILAINVLFKMSIFFKKLGGQCHTIPTSPWWPQSDQKLPNYDHWRINTLKSQIIIFLFFKFLIVKN